MIDYELQVLMPSTVGIELPMSRDAYSKVRWGDRIDYRCRVELRRSLVRDVDGREVVSSTTIFLATATLITHEARVTLEDGTHPSIVAIESVQDEDGSYVTKIFT